MKLEFGLEGRVALVCASSAGIGRGCADALAAAGATVILNGRDESRLAAAAAEMAKTHGRAFDFVVADAASDDGRAALLARCSDPDIVVNNAAGPPTGDFRDFSQADWHAALEGSMVAPIMMMRAVLDGMIARKWGRIINITSSAVKAPLPLLGLSNGARSGLTGFVAGLAREVAANGVTINNLLPGRIETDRLESYAAKVAETQGISVADAKAALAAANPMKRFGTIEEMGTFCAFLCSRQAAFLTGQNYLIDGGEFPGL
jgi:3-oxoacyl-[acyl-carrier protein] reductase